MSYENTPIQIGNKISILWNVYDNGFEIRKTGKVIECDKYSFILEMDETGDQVKVNKQSELWKKL